jgi:hypothetical protein
LRGGGGGGGLGGVKKSIGGKRGGSYASWTRARRRARRGGVVAALARWICGMASWSHRPATKGKLGERHWSAGPAGSGIAHAKGLGLIGGPYVTGARSRDARLVRWVGQFLPTTLVFLFFPLF